MLERGIRQLCVSVMPLYLTNEIKDFHIITQYEDLHGTRCFLQLETLKITHKRDNIRREWPCLNREL